MNIEQLKPALNNKLKMLIACPTLREQITVEQFIDDMSLDSSLADEFKDDLTDLICVIDGLKNRVEMDTSKLSSLFILDQCKSHSFALYLGTNNEGYSLAINRNDFSNVEQQQIYRTFKAGCTDGSLSSGSISTPELGSFKIKQGEGPGYVKKLIRSKKLAALYPEVKSLLKRVNVHKFITIGR